MPTDDELVGYFNKHIVPVFFAFQKGEHVHKVVITAFVLSVSEKWFLITAGHNIQDIEVLTDVRGYQITSCQLIDSLGVGATHRTPIPFAYRESHPTCLSDDIASH